MVESGYRRILEAAALLHEVGRSRGDRGHRKRAYSMIRRLTPPLGWSAEELQCVAVIARYHGGALPQISDSPFVGLTPTRRRALLPMAGVLRLADAFDFPHDQQIDRLTVERRDGMLIVYGRGLQEISPVAERAGARAIFTGNHLRMPHHGSAAGDKTGGCISRGTRPRSCCRFTIERLILNQATDFFL